MAIKYINNGKTQSKNQTPKIQESILCSEFFNEYLNAVMIYFEKQAKDSITKNIWKIPCRTSINKYIDAVIDTL